MGHLTYFTGHGKLFDHPEMEIWFYDGKILLSNGDISWYIDDCVFDDQKMGMYYLTKTLSKGLED
jgi:hypothetical protein